MLTQADRIQVLGDDTSGEVEPVLVGAADRLWVTVGADHTDRKLESYGVAVSKQVCPKVIGRTALALRGGRAALGPADAAQLRRPKAARRCSTRKGRSPGFAHRAT